MNKSFTRTLGAAALLLGLSLPVLAKDKIVIGEQNWTGAIAIQNILGEVIKSRLDGEVSYLAGDVPV
ncbi:glycine betaine ABC transporter substrate-binding protein, partial [Rhizobium sp. SIMBA_035]